MKNQRAFLYSIRRQKEWVVKPGYVFYDKLDECYKFQETDQYERHMHKPVKVSPKEYDIWQGMIWCTGEPNVDKIARIFLEWKLEMRDTYRRLLEATEEQIIFLNRQTDLYKELESLGDRF